jgi:hypothetical protein
MFLKNPIRLLDVFFEPLGRLHGLLSECIDLGFGLWVTVQELVGVRDSLLPLSLKFSVGLSGHGYLP